MLKSVIIKYFKAKGSIMSQINLRSHKNIRSDPGPHDTRGVLKVKVIKGYCKQLHLSNSSNDQINHRVGRVLSVSPVVRIGTPPTL